MEMHLLEVRNLRMFYRLRHGNVKAVDDLSFHLDRSETIGIVGESGCGKSSLGMALIGVLPPNGYYAGGEIILNRIDLLTLPEEELRRIRWSKISMIFQGAMNSLNPVFPVKDQILEALQTHERISEDEAIKRVREICTAVGLPESQLNSYPHEFSGGMRQRAIIAMSLICRPDVVIADEPTTALDVVVQDSILDQIRELQTQFDIGIVLISHDLSVVAERCDKIAIMYAGQLIETADSLTLFKDPRHPYTIGLLKSIPSVRGEMQDLRSLPGVPPSLMTPPQGCRFAPRCSAKQGHCIEQEPSFVEIGKDHYVRCGFSDKTPTMDHNSAIEG
jgi:peptide/nickel transport system ATP-binding protein